MAKPYIPPPNTYCRLLGVESKRVAVARTSSPYAASSHPKTRLDENQLFAIIPSTKHKGTDTVYLIQAKTTQMFLHARFKPDPRVGVNADGDTSTNWFKLEFGTGKHASHFRLACCVGHIVISCTTSGLKSEPGYIDDDYHYFSFLFDDMEVTDVTYHLDKAQSVNPMLDLVASQKGDNRSDGEQTISIRKIVTLSHTLTFERTDGYNIVVGTSFDVKLPFITSNGVKIEGGKTETVKWGTSIVQTEAYDVNFQLKVPAHTCVSAFATATYTIMDVPFTLTLQSSKFASCKVTTDGILRGVWKYDMVYTSDKC